MAKCELESGHVPRLVYEADLALFVDAAAATYYARCVDALNDVIDAGLLFFIFLVSLVRGALNS